MVPAALQMTLYTALESVPKPMVKVLQTNSSGFFVKEAPMAISTGTAPAIQKTIVWLPAAT
jgi:hypothetical protein